MPVAASTLSQLGQSRFWNQVLGKSAPRTKCRLPERVNLRVFVAANCDFGVKFCEFG